MAAHTTDVEHQPSFDRSLKLLDDREHGFGSKLWDLASLSCSAAQRIKAVEITNKRQVLKECLHEWREAMVSVIQSWAPRYVGVAISHQVAAPFDWAREQMQQVIENRLRKPDMNGAVAFWITTACGEHALDKHGSIWNKQSWRLPSWLRSRRPELIEYLASLPEEEQAARHQRETLAFIEEEHEHVVSRLTFALKEAISHVELDAVVNQPVQAADNVIVVATLQTVVEGEHEQQIHVAQNTSKNEAERLRGEQVAALNADLIHIAKSHPGLSFPEDELRKRLPGLGLWKAIDRSETLNVSARAGFFACALDVYRREDRFAFIAKIMGAGSGATAYNWYKRRSSDSGRRRSSTSLGANDSGVPLERSH